MSLDNVLQCKSISGRYKLLSAYLRDAIGGSELSEADRISFISMFSMYYCPDDDQVKFDGNDIGPVSIKIDKYGNKYFAMFVRSVDTWYPASIKRLSGKVRPDRANLIRAMRSSIEYQIQEFRDANPKRENDVCPITGAVMGHDAQVDHILPFHVLASRWLQDNPNPTYKYDLTKLTYELDEPYQRLWREYHKNNASLRWLSLNGNRIAHLSYGRASRSYDV